MISFQSFWGCGKEVDVAYYYHIYFFFSLLYTTPSLKKINNFYKIVRYRNQ